MATRIIEYAGLSGLDRTIVPANLKVLSQTALTATSTSAQSAAFDATTNVVCIDSDEAIKVNFGTNPTATDNDFKVKAGIEQFFEVKPAWKVAIKT
jgi:predicted transcriptional regulator